MALAIPANRRVKTKDKEKREVSEPCQRAKKAVEYDKTAIPIVIGALETVPKILLRGLEDVEIGEQIKTIQTPFFLIG